jgi:hypothetical protein
MTENKPIVKLFKKSELNDLDLPSGYNKDIVKVVIDEVIDTSRRWSEDHRLVFQLPDMQEDEAWETYYSVGKTEQQDERPWEYEDEIECTLVKRKEKTIIVWE